MLSMSQNSRYRTHWVFTIENIFFIWPGLCHVFMLKGQHLENSWVLYITLSRLLYVVIYIFCYYRCHFQFITGGENNFSKFFLVYAATLVIIILIVYFMSTVISYQIRRSSDIFCFISVNHGSGRTSEIHQVYS